MADFELKKGLFYVIIDYAHFMCAYPQSPIKETDHAVLPPRRGLGTSV